jgi:hypothetical protein
MTADLLELGDWLATQGVTHVAMESIGVYWKLESAAGDADGVADNTFLYLAKVRLVTRDIPARWHMLAFGLAAWANSRSVPLGQGR